VSAESSSTVPPFSFLGCPPLSPEKSRRHLADTSPARHANDWTLPFRGHPSLKRTKFRSQCSRHILFPPPSDDCERELRPKNSSTDDFSPAHSLRFVFILPKPSYEGLDLTHLRSTNRPRSFLATSPGGLTSSPQPSPLTARRSQAIDPRSSYERVLHDLLSFIFDQVSVEKIFPR